MNNSMQSLVFQGIKFDVTDRNGQHWIGLHQIGVALQYKRHDILNKLYRAHADEFTDKMTALVEQMTAGGKQLVRIFSLRGAHLLAMFARTPVAKKFRRWVLDVLDEELERMRNAGKSIRALGPRHLNEIKAILSKRVLEAVMARVPDHMNQQPAIERAYTCTYNSLLDHFDVKSVAELPASKFLAAREFVETVKVDWELEDKPAPGAHYHFPISDTKPHDHDPRLNNDMLSPQVLLDPRNRQLEIELLDQMQKDGHDVSGVKLRVLAMRSALARFIRTQERMGGNWVGRVLELADEMRNYSREEGIGALYCRPLDPKGGDALVFREQFAAMGGAHA